MANKPVFSDSIAVPPPPEAHRKHRIQIMRIVPMHDLVLLIAFRDKELNMLDVRFLVNRIDGLSPRTEPEQFKIFLLNNRQCIMGWEEEIGSAAPEPGEDAPTIDLSMPEDLFQELNEICNILGVTIPQLIRAMLCFYVDPDSQEAVQKWFGLKFVPIPHSPEESKTHNPIGD